MGEIFQETARQLSAASRHDRRHQGLGLSIAKRFLEEQGGFLEYGNRTDTAGAEVYGNRTDTTGAEVTMWLKIEERKAFFEN